MNWEKEYENWLSCDVVDDITKAELKSISDNEEEIKERFYKNLEFGTAGLRGVIAAGTNRMNIYTVRKATQGIAADIIKCGEEARGVVISYDSRNMSYEFAMETAKVLAANGIKAYVFDELRPVPELSFAVRYLKCARGIMITASHNPKEYNGYKAYGADGGQLPPESSDYVTSIIDSIDIFKDIKVMAEDEAKAKGLISVVGEEIDKAYLAAVKEQSVNEENYRILGDDFKIVYSPFHGAGNKPVRKILEMTGAKNVFVVKEQEMPDGNFSTVKSPNPEDKEGFALAIELGKKEDADVIFATDPDCDRIGVVVKDDKGDYITLTGNQMGVLLTEFILRNKKANGTLPDNGAVIKTIVTTPMVCPIAEEYGVKVYDVLTGFKFIGEKMTDFEQNNYYNRFLFGFEESYGCLAGTYARDKDAVVAAMLICQMAADYKVQGLTLYEGLEKLYKKYGYYYEKLHTFVLKGLDGVEKIKSIMERFRLNPVKEVNGIAVTDVWDVKKGVAIAADGTCEKLDFPPSDVIKYYFEDGSWVAMRPSGTEPKIKFYFGVRDNDGDSAKAKMESLCESILKMM
ncbi:MAG: phospho-sugar mutase [Ruminococcaceae bacterium]|nr:phospho-sugar mutase [Oscillospiraceae bacterium]